MSYQRIAAEQLTYELDLQGGVASYAQLISGGWTWPRIRKAVRRRELSHVHPRVYVGHTGPLTPRQRAWAAVLYAEPAALCLESALAPAADGDIHLAVEQGRRLAGTAGVVIHQVTRLDRQIRAFTDPPRLSHEHNLLMQIRLAADEETVVGLLAGSVGRRGVTVETLGRALELHPRQPHKRLVVALLSDIETGIESVLEHGYLARVERAHGLPRPKRQLSRPNGERRDGEHPGWASSSTGASTTTRGPRGTGTPGGTWPITSRARPS